MPRMPRVEEQMALGIATNMRPNVKTDTIVLCFLVYSLVPFSMEVLNLPTRIIWCG